MFCNYNYVNKFSIFYICNDSIISDTPALGFGKFEVCYGELSQTKLSLEQFINQVKSRSIIVPLGPKNNNFLTVENIEKIIPSNIVFKSVCSVSFGMSFYFSSCYICEQQAMTKCAYKK